MKVLLKLRWMRIWASIRNVFSKWSSGLLAVFLIILYGGLAILMIFGERNPINMGNMIDMHTGVLISIGFTALLVCITMFQKRKALIMGEEAFYLFTGPFKRNEVMKYIVTNNIVGSLTYAALSLFMFVMLGSGLAYDFMFYVSVAVLNALIAFFFLMLTDYLYLLGMNENKYNTLSRGIVITLVVLTILLYGWCVIQKDFDLQRGFYYFITSKLFYVIPMFGWGKLSLVSWIEGNVGLYFLGYALIIIGIVVIVKLFVSYKENFVEQALEDAMYYSELMRNTKAGKVNAQQLNEKVKAVDSNFKSGAMAIYSKGLLMMRKTNGFINETELLILVLYIVISYLMGLGFGFYMYMIILWLFGLMKQSDLSQELKNYQIYLIPENPLKKLLALIIPTFIKVMVLVSVASLVGMVIFATPVKEMFQYLLIIYGYVFVLIAGSILSIRILKSRNNAMMENMLTMGIMILCAVPGIMLTMYLIANPEKFTMTLMNVIAYSSIVLNFVVSALIIYSCKNMLNGRELKED